MSIVNSIKNIVGMGSTGEAAGPTPEEMGFESDERDEEVMEEEVEEDVEEIEEVVEFPSAFAFADEFLQKQGFSGAQEAAMKWMAMRVKSSPEFRDRIQTGAETIEMVTDSIEKVESFGETSGMSNFEQLANDFRSANELVNEVEEFTSDDSMLIRQGFVTTNRILDFLDGSNLAKSSDVETTKRMVDEDL